MVKLICTDFDGTIHDPADNPPVSREFLDYLRATQGAGVRWVLSTGRVLADIVPRLQPITNGVWPDFIVAVERVIYERRDGEYQDHSAWNTRCRAAHAELFQRADENLRALRRWIEKYFEARLYTDEWSPFSIVTRDASDADRIHARIETVCREIPDLCVMRNTLYFRFAHRHYTKGTALNQIARRLGIKKEAVFAAGDHFNDLDMLDGVHAACVATPSNAIPEVKAVVIKAGGYVASRAASRGVVEALQHFAMDPYRKRLS